MSFDNKLLFVYVIFTLPEAKQVDAEIVFPVLGSASHRPVLGHVFYLSRDQSAWVETSGEWHFQIVHYAKGHREDLVGSIQHMAEHKRQLKGFGAFKTIQYSFTTSVVIEIFICEFILLLS